MNIELNLSQKQILSPQYIQLMEILQKGTVELNDYIENLALENPLIALEPCEEESTNERNLFLQRKRQWLESDGCQNKAFYQDDHSEEWENAADSRETLYVHLRSQLTLNQYSYKERGILDYLLQSLDSKGYYRDDPVIAAEELHVSVPDVLRLLSDIKELDPAGVGARDLSECLLLQLQRMPEHSPVAEEIAQHHLESLAKNHIDAIARKLHVSRDEIKRCFCELKKLNPIPGNSFGGSKYTPYVRPDIVVTRFENDFDVLVSDYGYSRVTLQKDYLDLESESSDMKTKEFIHEKKRQAVEVINAVAQRKTTLSKICRLIVQYQSVFFMKGPDYIQPLTLETLAAQAGISISAVSRALNNKYLQCSWGVFPLKHFLRRRINDQTCASVSNKQLENAISQIIEEEDKKRPLSDERICAYLQENGINVARRTVAKYRTLINIPDRNGRRQKPS